MKDIEVTFSVITCTYNQLPLLKKAKKHWDKQTFKDFEWIIADDGSTDGTKEWAKKNGIKIYSKAKNTGFDFVGNLNEAVKLAGFKYLVWVMGDSYPAEDFLDKLSEVVKPNRVVNGLRITVSKEGKIVGEDWRIPRATFNLTGNETLVIHPYEPWELMTLNSMCMPRKMFKEMGGICEEYKGYGRMDTDMAMWAYFNGYKLYWATKAIIYHLEHPDRVDSPENDKVFHKRLEEFRKNETNTRI